MNIFIEALIFVFCYFVVFFIIGTSIKNNSIVDFGWGAGFFLTALFLIVKNSLYDFRAMMLLLLVGLWGIRLSYHIFIRNLDKPEDFRYQGFRAKWGKHYLVRGFLEVYMLQGFLMIVVLSPVILSLRSERGFSIFDVLGVAVWIIGYYFEVVGDKELKDFKKDPSNKGKIITTGLWSLTRHPNYFGEATMWWGVFIICFGATFSLLTLVGPIAITYLLLYVSGVPMLEKKYEGRQDFENYKKTTPKFFPKLNIASYRKN